jgi:hypothetical protein
VAGGSFEAEPWERVDIALPNPQAGRRDDKVCSILDVQSFVIAGDRGQKFGVGAKSVVRVNLGRHRYTTDKVKSIVRKSGTRKNDMHRYEDGILETAFMDACYEVLRAPPPPPLPYCPPYPPIPPFASATWADSATLAESATFIIGSPRRAARQVVGYIAAEDDLRKSAADARAADALAADAAGGDKAAGAAAPAETAE